MRVCGGILGACALAFAGAQLARAVGGPSASFSWSPTAPTVAQTVTFTNGSATDPASTNATLGYSWSFDGTTNSETNPTHVYSDPGDHTVTLVATQYNALGSPNGSATTTATISVGAAATGPVDDFYTAQRGQELIADAKIGVLANDPPGTEVLGGQYAHSTKGFDVLIQSDGSFGYGPASFVGQDSFVYQTIDPQTGAVNGSATVTIDVDGVVARSDTYTVAAGGSTTVPAASGVLANDDGYPDAPTVALSKDASHGTVKLSSDGSFTYTPDGSGYTGADSFAYVAVGNDDTSNATVVNLDVAPANDDFDGATVFDGDSGSVDGTTLGATVETDPNEPHVGGGSPIVSHTVWYAWTPATTGRATLAFDGGFEGGIGVYIGSKGSLNQSTFATATADDRFAQWNVTAGTTYYVQVGVEAGDPGPFTLQWTIGDDLQQGTVVDAAAGGASLEGATVTLLNSDHNPVGQPPLASATPDNPLTTGADGAWAWLVAAGSYEVRAEKSGCGETTQALTLSESGNPAPMTLRLSCAAAAEPPGNDDFASPQALDGDSGSVQGTTANATVEDGEPGLESGIAGTVWYAWQPSKAGSATVTLSGGHLAVYTGDTLSSLELAGQSDAEGTAVFDVAAGTTYYLQAGAQAGESGPIALTWSLGAPRPANDDFADALPLPGDASGSATGTTVSATTEDGEPTTLAQADVGTGNTVWWTWTAPSTGAFSFDTSGSNEASGTADFDSTLAVFSGSDLANLTELASDDDDGDGTFDAALAFEATAGTTYYVQVGSYYGESTGPVQLHWAAVVPPANDDFANADTLEGTSGSVDGSVVAATFQIGEPDPFADGDALPLDDTVWYAWTAPGSGSAVFTLGSDFTGALAIYTGDALSSLQPVGFQEGSSSTSVEFPAQEGTTYLVQVGTYDDDPGAFALDWTQSETPSNDALAGTTTLTGPSGTIGGTTAGATVDTDAGEDTTVPIGDVDHEGARSVWYRWQPPADGDVQIALSPESQGDGLPPVGLVQLYSGPPADLGYDDLNPVGTHSDGEHLDATVTADSTYYVQVMADTNADTEQEFDFSLAWAMAAQQRSISGSVLAADGSAVQGALVRACAGGDCTDAKSNSDGVYAFSTLDPASYVVRAYPTDPSSLVAERTVDVTDESVDGADLRFVAAGSASSASGPTTFTVAGCTGGTLHYTVSDGSSTLGSGDVADGGGGTYAIDLSSLALGHRPTLRFALTFACPDSTESSTAILFSDPSGTVVDDDAGGAALAGATVTLLDADGNAIPAGDTRMSRATAENPETSDSRGGWGWDVAPGVYRVRAEKDGCGTETTDALAVSPDDPATGIVLHLSCGTTTTTTTTTSGGGAPPPPSFPPAPPSPPSPPLPDPVQGVNANFVTLAGTVLVNGVPLVGGAQIPFGATVDATQGIVALTTIGPTGEKQTAYFFGGVFKVVQGADGATELVLSQGDFSVCTPTGTQARKTIRHVSSASAKKPPKPKKKNGAKAKKGKNGKNAGKPRPGTAKGISSTGKPRSSKIVRSLWGTGKGSFRTKGRYSAATVRGTLWFTADRCDGTYTQVNDGVVEVQDEVRNLVLTVAAGHSVLVRPKNG